MRSSSWGKRARLEGKPYPQDEHVTEADMVSREMTNPRLPRSMGTPTMAKGCGDERGGRLVPSSPNPASGVWQELGPIRSSQSVGRVSRAARRVKGSEGHL